ncbi:O-glucosyltransferase rumi [Cinnamomum micranthum f. kanehirae]|uniref:O-glucosyltransferase rumi n=1 Tax=Cinnamomum micranthum f. kanehirae TaxID=337451 RepID=A0A3S3NPN3_9MAGN|nr:O-glucosyltransferase rumi [Cinnamomum micranthum f. kanehirae]
MTNISAGQLKTSMPGNILTMMISNSNDKATAIAETKSQTLRSIIQSFGLGFDLQIYVKKKKNRALCAVFSILSWATGPGQTGWVNPTLLAQPGSQAGYAGPGQTITSSKSTKPILTAKAIHQEPSHQNPTPPKKPSHHHQTGRRTPTHPKKLEPQHKQTPQNPLLCPSENHTRTCHARGPSPTVQSYDDADPPSCPDYFRWIHEDLRPWKGRGISKEMVERAKRTATFRVVVLDGRVYVESFQRAFQTRDVYTLWGYFAAGEALNGSGAGS